MSNIVSELYIHFLQGFAISHSVNDIPKLRAKLPDFFDIRSTYAAVDMGNHGKLIQIVAHTE